MPGAKAGSSAAGSTFRDSWDAQVGSADLLDKAVGTDSTSDVNDPSSLQEAVDGTDAGLRHLQGTPGISGVANADNSKAVRNSVTGLGVRERQHASPNGKKLGEIKISGKQASDAASQISSFPQGFESQLQTVPVVVPNPDKGHATAPTASSTDSSNAVVSAPLNLPAISSAASAGAAPAGAASAGAVPAVPVPAGASTAEVTAIDAASVEKSISSGTSSATGNLQIGNAHGQGPGDDEGKSNRSVALRESTAGIDFAANQIAAAADYDGANVELDTGVSGEQSGAAMPLHLAPDTKNQEKEGSGIENGGFYPHSPEELPGMVRDAMSLTESHDQLSTASSAAVGESLKAARHSTSRASLSSSRTEGFKQAATGSLDAFAAHPLAIPRISETVSAYPKSGASISGGTRLEETFTALESGTRVDSGGSNSIRSGRLQAEAGYQDPTLGWIGIRAEASRGMIHATVLSPTPDVAQALSGHMAGLHTHLAENRTPVDTLTFTSLGSNGQHLPCHDSGGGMYQGAEQHAGRDNPEPVLDQQSTTTRVFPSGVSRNASASNEVFARADADRVFDGVHISVVV